MKIKPELFKRGLARKRKRAMKKARKHHRGTQKL